MAKKDMDKFKEKKVGKVPGVVKFLLDLITLALILAVLIASYLLYFKFTDQEIKPEFAKNIVDKVTGKAEEPVEVISTDPLYSKESYPKIDGSTATIPLAQAFQADFTGQKLEDVEIKHSKTHQAYEALVKKDVDCILVVEPSSDELKMANEADVTYDVTKIVNEGFVFFLNRKNPVDSLTVEQIQDIYSGKIKNWKEVGGNDEPIVAYQRPRNSGSQTGMESIVMKDISLMEAPAENISLGMEDIIDAVSNYENSSGAIGYSYYYYANTMYLSDDVKMLKVNDVEPNNTTIKDGSYPFLTAYYAVSLKGLNPVADSLKEKMLSTRGQQVVEKAGYVPVK